MFCLHILNLLYYVHFINLPMLRAFYYKIAENFSKRNTKKNSPVNPYRYQDIVNKSENILLTIMTSMTMFT